jgi:drug/metabolite transporter (DMT)-like permease
MKKETLGALSVLGLFYCSIVLGTHYIITKQLSSSFDAGTLTAYRFLIAAIPLYFYILSKRKNPFENIKPGIVLGFFLWLVFILIAMGLKYTSATSAGFISGLFFIFVPIISYFVFKTRIKLVYFPIFIISSVGLYFLTGGLSQMGIGSLLILFSAIFTAVHVVLVGYFSKRGLDPAILCFQQFFVVFILSLISALATQGFRLDTPEISQILPLLFLGLLPTFSVFFVQVLSLKYSSEITAAIILSLQPGFSAFFSYWLGGEMFTTFQLIGGVLLFVSAVLFSYFKRNAENKPV